MGNTQLVTGEPGGKNCKTDSDCFGAYILGSAETNNESDVPAATTIAEKAKRCCQYTLL